MISSTRSSESASRSSWNDASSVMSASSIPSCSVSTSLTRSKTSSRDAAMSPHSCGGWPGKSRRSYNLRPPWQACCEAADHVVVDAAGGEADRIRDRRPRGVAVRDHREPAQAEQVGAAVRVGIEAMAEPARRRADQQAAQLARRRRRDLCAEGVEDRADRPLEELQRDVAGEAVGHDDVGSAGEQVAPLAVSLEIEVARGEQLVRLERELVALLGLFPDREEAHPGLCDSEDLLGEYDAHRRELEQVLGPRVGVRAGR